MESAYDHEVAGEVIKMIHGELPAVRWTCGECGEDSCTIFFDPAEAERVIACEYCGASNLVVKAAG
jgi:DNA-directed RNA polymerase subunit RPC12/RpoP